MLLSPLGSPSRFNPASFCLPLPHLQHELINCDCEDDDDEAFGSIGSISSDDENDNSSDSDECASSRTSLSDDDALDVDVDVDSALVLVDDYVPVTDVDLSVEAEPLPPHSTPSPPPSSPPLPSDSLAYPKRRSGPELPVEAEASELALPVELIFAVVELAASHRRTAVSLCRVASWVRAAVLPILYGTLVLQGSEWALPFDAVGDDERVAVGGGDDDDDGGGGSGALVRRLESPLKHVRSLWLDVPADRAPRSFDACVRLRQLALPLEAHATICNTQRWLAYDPRFSHSTTSTTARKSNALHVDGIDSHARDDRSGVPCRSFTVLGQSHPHRWAPLTSSPNGRAFLRGVTHLRILNLCLSHYIPLEYTPNLTHLCIPFFDLRISPSTLSSSPTALDLSDTSSLTGSAATSSFTGLDYILSSPSLQMVVLTLNPRYWRFDELSLKGWAIRAMARDPRLYVVAETRDDATRDWDVPRRDWEDEARGGAGVGGGGGGEGRMSVWEKAVCVRRKFLTRLSRSWGEGYRV